MKGKRRREKKRNASSAASSCRFSQVRGRKMIMKRGWFYLELDIFLCSRVCVCVRE